MTSSYKAFTILVFFVLVATGAAARAHAVTITWTGAAGNGNWQTPGNWDLARVPDNGDDVVIPNLAGTASVTHSAGADTINTLTCAEVLILSGGSLDIAAASSSTNSLSLSGATIRGAGDLSISGAFSWTQGSMLGTGTTTVASGVAWTLGGSFTLTLSRTLVNNGIASRVGTAGVQIDSPGLLRNTGTINCGDNGGFGSNGSIQNESGAVFAKPSGSGTATIAPSFTNSSTGAVNVNSGTLVFSGSVTNNGSMTAAAGTTLQVGGAFNNPAGSTLTIAGTLSVTGGTTTIDAAANFGTPAAISLTGGTFSLAPDVSVGSLALAGPAILTGAGDIDVTGALSWTQGAMSGTGVTTVAPGVSWNWGGGFTLTLSRTLVNNGTASRVGTASVQIDAPGVLRNTGTINCGENAFSSNGSIQNESGAVFAKPSGGGTTTVAPSFTNSSTGAVNANSGTLVFSGNVTNDGSMTAAAGATLRHSGTVASTAGSTIAIAGTLSVTGGTTTIDAAANFGTAAAISLTGGTFSLAPDVSVGTLTLAGGTLTGAGDVEVTSSFSFAHGTMSGTGTTTVAPGIVWNWGGSFTPLLSRTLVNNGFASPAGTSSLQVASPGVLQNNASIDLTGNQGFSGSGSIQNESGALLVKSGGAGTSTIVPSLANNGTLRVSSGTLQLTGPFPNFVANTLTGGTYEMIGATFKFNGASVATNAAAIVLDGTASAIVNQSGVDGIATLASNAAAGSLTLKNGRSLAVTPALANAGTVVLGPGGATLTANAGYTQTSGSTRLDGGTVASTALVNIDGGSLLGSGTVAGNLTNDGVVAAGASPGAISVTGNYAQTSGGQLAVEIAGVAPGTQFDALNVTGNASLGGDLQASLIDGFVPAVLDSFEILSASSVTGTFANDNLPISDAPGCIEVGYRPAAVRLTQFESAGIVTPPSSQTVCSGAPVTFSVTATGTEIAFQWRKNGANISGANSSAFTIAPVAPTDAGSYDVLVSNACGGLPTAPAVLTVDTPAVVTLDPQSQTLCSGTPVNLFVETSGTPPVSFQWRRDGTPLAGATQNPLTFPSVELFHAGNYDVVVTNACGADTSAIAALVVNIPPVVTTQSTSVTACAGVDTFLVCGRTGIPAPTLQWRKDGVAIPGATSSPLPLLDVEGADAGIYDAVITNVCSTIVCDPIPVIVNAPAVITQEPEGQTVCEGDAVTFTVDVGGTGPLTFQWRKDGVAIAGATGSAHTIVPVSRFLHMGNYDVLVANSCGADTSAAAALVVNRPPEIAIQPQDTTACAGDTVSVFVGQGGIPLPAIQWRKDGVPIAGANFAQLQFAGVQAADAGVYDAVLANVCDTVLTSPAVVTVNTPAAITQGPQAQSLCEGGPALLFVAVAGSPQPAIQWRKDGVAIAGATDDSLAFDPITLDDSGSYDAVVANACGADTSAVATLTVSEGLEITEHPAGTAACLGDTVTFTVGAQGSAPAYQWRKDAVNIPGATSPSLTLATVTGADAATYDVVVTGTCGSLTSDPALLAVQSCPDTVYVSAAADSGGDGESWATAINDLQPALVAAAATTDLREIWVAGGTYTPSPSSRSMSFTLASAVALYGGFGGGETSRDARDPEANPTILSGDLAGNDGAGFANYSENSLRVVHGTFADSTAILDGFVVAHGNANTAGPGATGAGISIFGSGRPTIRRCAFVENSASTQGGAVAIGSTGRPTFESCRFRGNRVVGGAGGGGAVAATGAGGSLFSNCRFESNTAPRGGAFSTTTSGGATISNSVFSGNRASFGGGAIRLASSGPASIVNCTLSADSAGSTGGGILVDGNSGAVAIANCVLWGNRAGGAAGEAAQIFVTNSTAPNVSYCDIEGLTGALGGAGNIGLDPLFVDADGADGIFGTLDDSLTVGALSPCIDAGDNAAVPADVVLDAGGNARFFDDACVIDTGSGTAPIVDIGAYEFSESPCVTGVDAPPAAGASLAVAPPAPNPSRGGTTLRFSIPSAGKVVAQVFDASGRRVTDLIDGDLPAGEHRVSWNGRDSAGQSVASGVYFLKLESARGSRVARFVVIR